MILQLKGYCNTTKTNIYNDWEYKKTFHIKVRTVGY